MVLGEQKYNNGKFDAIVSALTEGGTLSSAENLTSLCARLLEALNTL